MVEALYMNIESNVLKDLSDAPLWQKVFFVIIIGIIVFYTLRNIVFYGSIGKLNELKKTQFEQEMNIKSYRFLDQNLKHSEQELKSVLSSERALLLNKNDFPIVLSNLTTKSLDNIKINNIRPGKEIVQKKYVTKDLFVSCEGTLSGLMNFYSNLQSFLLSSTIDSITITRKDSQKFYSEIFITSYLTTNTNLSIPLKSQGVPSSGNISSN